jgi:hopanoid biosynthesis associated radical SAM protein HpnH
VIYSLDLSKTLIKHIYRNNRKKNKYIPFVLMLEPLFKCNLACSGCGRIREYKDVLDRKLTREECIEAAVQAGAPIVSITGGEPLLHPEMKQIIRSLLASGYFVYLCTNGLLLEDFLDEIAPHPDLSLVIHLDGMAETHNHFAKKPDVFEKAVRAIKKAKKLGFNIRSNTTIYKDTDVEEIRQLFSLLKEIGTDGVMVSPAFSYEVLGGDDFLSRQQVFKVFTDIYNNLNGTRLYNTPVYWDFLKGQKELQCIPWSTPTYNIKGWKSPCYLLTDDHYQTYREMIDRTEWEKYGTGKDPRCSNCMAHCGYEASSIQGKKNFKDILKLAKWNMTGRS